MALRTLNGTKLKQPSRSLNTGTKEPKFKRDQAKRQIQEAAFSQGSRPRGWEVGQREVRFK